MLSPCPAFDEECSRPTVENNYYMEMVSLINGVTGDHNNRSDHELLGRDKIIFDEQPAYDKAKELETCSERFSKSNTVLVLWSIGDLYIFCESYQII